MARKSKLTVLRERLEAISKCPYDVFHKIEATDLFFERLQKAENGDASSISELSQMVFNTYKDAACDNHAMLYFLGMGIEASDIKSAENLVFCAAKRCRGFELLDRALSMLAKAGYAQKDLIEEAIIKKALFEAEEHPKKLTEILNILPEKQEPYLELYLIGKAQASGIDHDLAHIRELCLKTGVARLYTLPIFGGKDQMPPSKEEARAECDTILKILTAIEMTEWHEFWQRVIYEYSTIYLESDLSFFARYIIRSLKRTKCRARDNIYTLAWMKYAIDHGYVRESDNFEQRYKEVLEECIFDGELPDLCDKDVMDTLLREALCRSCEDRIKEEEKRALGNLISHKKNRYVMRCYFENHAKRANKHMWETTISIETENDTPPVFRNIVITERRNSISRDGYTLEPQKGLSQVICSGDLIICGKAYPFELDLILDISYVSSTKCELGSIKVRKYGRQGKYLVMNCQMYIY